MENIYNGSNVKELIKSDFNIKYNKLNDTYKVFLKKQYLDGINAFLVIYSPMCEPCVLSKDMWENLARLFKYKFKIYALNSYNFRDFNQDMTLPLNVTSYPDYKFIDRKGEVLDYDGEKSEAEITKFIIKNI